MLWTMTLAVVGRVPLDRTPVTIAEIPGLTGHDMSSCDAPITHRQ
jgi:hypothetical protein